MSPLFLGIHDHNLSPTEEPMSLVLTDLLVLDRAHAPDPSHYPMWFIKTKMRQLFAGLRSLITIPNPTNESLPSFTKHNSMSPQKDTALPTKSDTLRNASTVSKTLLSYKDAMKRRSKSDKKPYRLPFTIV